MVSKKTVVKRQRKTARVSRKPPTSNKSTPKKSIFSAKYKNAVTKKSKSKSKSTKRGASEYQLFVKKHMKDPKFKHLPVTDRMRKVAELWNQKTKN